MPSLAPTTTPLGAEIRRSRERIGLNQTELAESLGVRQASVSRWEKGETRPLASHYQQLHDLTGADLEVFWRQLAADRLTDTGRYPASIADQHEHLAEAA